MSALIAVNKKWFKEVYKQFIIKFILYMKWQMN